MKGESAKNPRTGGQPSRGAAGAPAHGTHERLEHLTLVLRAIRKVNQLITREKDRDRLLQGACETLIETRGYCNAWIVLLGEDGRLVTAAEAGWGDAFFPVLEHLNRGELPNCVRKAQGQTGVVVIPDPASDCADCPLSDHCSGQTGMAVRLENTGKVHGLLAVSIPAELGGNEEERGLFADVAGDIAFALTAIEADEKRKRAEEALRAERDKAQKYLDVAGVMFVAINRDGRIMLINRKGCNILGYEEEEVLGKNWFDNFLPERIRDSITPVSQRLLAGEVGSAEHFENPVLTKSGEERLIAWHNTVLRDEEGNVVGHLSSGEDITERKRAEESLRRSEERLRLIFEHSNDGINMVEFDPETSKRRLLMCNDRYVEMSGHSREQLMAANNLNELVQPYEDPQRGQEEYRKILRGVPFTGRNSWIRPDGKENHYEWTAAPIRIDERICILGIDRDITDRRRAEREVRKFKTIAARAGYGVAVADLEGKLTYVNGSFAEMHGYAAEELLGRNLSVLHSEQQMNDVERLNTKLQEAGAYVAEEVWHKRRDGSVFPAVMNGTLIRDGEGKALFMAATAVDITDRKRMEEQLRQSQKMEAVGHLAGGVAHDFRNQLLVIKWCAERLLKRALVGDEGRDDVREIIKASDRSARLTNQLLAFSRREMLQPRTVDLPELVQDLSSSLQPIIGEDIRLSLLRSACVCHVHLDPDQLQQAIMNLAVNARDAMPNGGELTIETDCVEVGEEFTRLHPETSCGLYAVVAVKDTGVGMDAETVGQIFEPFFTTKQGGEGTGLGLSTVYGFVKQSGGVIKVDSTPGDGSTFSLYFPVVAEAEESAKPADEDREPLTGQETILVVEDEESVRWMLAQSLREAGYTVLETANAREALPQGEHYDGRIDMLLADVVMPGMGGPELAEHIRKVRPDIAVLHISGYVGRDLPQRGLESGKAPLLIKPFSPEQLLRRVREGLDAAAGRRADG